MQTIMIRYFVLAIISIAVMQCTRNTSKGMHDKIQFDYSDIDVNGLFNGDVSVDYEFCIPADTMSLRALQKIAPEVKVMKASKGRVGCTSAQWLCINSTHSPRWKDELLAIASLDFVDRIIQTFYE